uniref:Mitochondrial chaperone BCS1 n=1 Tax=Arundo donax TaxID=35708 RepID=A0A0A9DZB1_ARUDO
MASDKAMESYKKAITTAASVAASLMLVRSVVNEVVPYEVREMLFSGVGYLATRINASMQQRLRVSSMDENDKMMVSMAEGEEMVDVYDGAEFKWCLICHDNSSDSSSNGFQHELRSFEVSFHKKHKEKALQSYFPFILLYGPPGTGKSSLIAAMANHLRFDIYDLELSEVRSNSDLRRLLVGMSNRAILVIEDIDCTIELFSS